MSAGDLIRDRDKAAEGLSIVTNEVVALPSGMNRDTEEGKLDYTLIMDGPMYDRWAAHLTAAVPTRGERNWMKADSEDDYRRFRRSLSRHMRQYFRGDADEDHAAAIFFNLNGAEYVRTRLDS